MRITGNTIYEHDEHGEVLVIDVHHIFDDYDLESESGDPHSRVVRFTTDWDGYGPMPGSIQTRPTADFQELIGGRVRTIDPLGPESATDDS
jgi:hypothetical protein